ncbi:MAG TPA: metallophosphoesterase family protein [Dehalococcoidia bacterium]|jgi:diadenosine tetraphosphatase ApaH/serine/threonine PP2A family protein phosphatase|nr:metallophosphoesterase family protein [Dehalococcoidia bacterium]
MKIAIVSDVHANLEALTAVLADADARGATDVWCTGDTVGYGPDPSAVLTELRQRRALMVAGNHDLAACGRMGVEAFNPVAAEAARWTRAALSDDQRAFLASLPLTHIAGAFTLVHGTLRDPEWEYLLTLEQAEAQFALQTTPYSIVGHTHLPMVVRERGERPAMRRLQPGDGVELGDGRLILNPGGAGQPRDGDPRAPYMLYDEGAATISFHRVPYDIAATRRKIHAAGLPEWLGERLERGQ